MTDEKLFSLAKNISELSDFRRCHIGCIAVYKKKIILSTGFNCNKTHPLQRKYNLERFPDDFSPHSLHAEVHTLAQIRDLDIDWEKVEIYTYRQLKTGSIAMSRPCKSCMKLIKDFGIKKIHFTTENGFAEENIHR